MSTRYRIRPGLTHPVRVEDGRDGGVLTGIYTYHGPAPITVADYYLVMRCAAILRMLFPLIPYSLQVKSKDIIMVITISTESLQCIISTVPKLKMRKAWTFLS